MPSQARQTSDALRLARVVLPTSSEPEAILNWTSATFGNDVILTSSFGADSALMLHMVTRVIPRVRVVFIDTGYLFPETYRFIEALKQRFELDIRVYAPALTSARLEALYGRLWQGDASDLARYQQLTKVEPMERALRELRPKAWVAGLRRSQTSYRASIQPVEEHGSIYKVSPILDYSDEDVARYLERHGLPHHPLFHLGYRSIGDVHSTRPTTIGQQARDGRRLGPEQECGIHQMLGR